MPFYELDVIVARVTDYLESDGGSADRLDVSMLGLMGEMGVPKHGRFQR